MTLCVQVDAVVGAAPASGSAVTTTCGLFHLAAETALPPSSGKSIPRCSLSLFALFASYHSER